MRKTALFVLVALAIIGALSCKDSTTGPSPQGLSGTWKATKAEYVSAADSSKKVDIVAQGSTLTLVLETGSFTLTITDPGEAPSVTTGTWTSSSDTLTLAPSGTSFTWMFNMTQSGNNLTLSGGHVQFDFSGALEEAILNRS